MPAIMPRTADIAPAGHAAFMMAYSGTFGPTALHVRALDGTTRVLRERAATDDAYVGGGDAGPPINVWPHPELQLRIGTGGSCEAGVVLGFLRLGPEVRCGVLQQARGDAVSVAGSAAWFWKPGAGTEWRVGVDVSHHDHRRGEASYAAVGGAYVTYGDERHAMWLDEPHLRNPSVAIVRKELRLTVPLAVAIDDPDGSDSGSTPAIVLGVIPYWTIRARPRGAPDCQDCTTKLEITGFDSTWGLGPVLGLFWPGWVPRAR